MTDDDIIRFAASKLGIPIKTIQATGENVYWVTTEKCQTFELFFDEWDYWRYWYQLEHST